ncbi:hypothetical protein TrVE_jg2860 [Triparma verrucosa]|uniref:Auxin efflux carrier family protein n=1 Tax=Triparma verrucosa TaxID=1606542 RepID=A0A9W7EU31_9STRA|nr:hypothetical protein TrVE_jg2860 [Triparma verrucosa]
MLALPSVSPAAKVTFTAVGQLFVNTSVGSTAVLSGLINSVDIKALARIVYAVLTPSFLFSSTLHTLSKYGFSPDLLCMPFCAALQVLLALMLTRKVVLPLLGIDRNSDEGRELALLSTFGNPGIYPLLLWTELFGRNYLGSPALLPQLTAYMTFYLLGTSPMLWSVGKAIMMNGKGTDEACLVGEAEDCIGPSRITKVLKALRALITPPPVAGALMGVLVASVPPLRALFVGPNAPLNSIVSSIDFLGKAYLPSASLVLAGSFVGEARFKFGKGKKEKVKVKGKVVDGLKRRIFAVGCIRFVLLPTVGLTVLRTLCFMGIFPAPLVNPALWFFFATQFMTPPAQNTVIVAQLAGSPAGATRIARALFILYVISAVPVSIVFSRMIPFCGL